MSTPELEKKLLFKGVDCTDIQADELIRNMRASEDDVDAALDALSQEQERVSMTLHQALSREACGVLRRFVDEHVVDCITVDSMDGETEAQVIITKPQLESLIGKDEVSCLWSLPQQLEVLRRDGQPTLPPVWLGTISLRKYTAAGSKGRTHLGFHIDSDSCTVNVALGGSYTGGQLLLAVGGRVVEVQQRDEGDVTMHIGEVAHAVTQVTSGCRYSLLLFFNRPGFLFQTTKGRFRKPASPPS